MNIRTEIKQDYEKVFQLNVQAFGNREEESRLIERIRVSPQFVPALSLVAEEDGEIVGHLLLSKAEVVCDESAHEVIVLAPIAVHPQFQKSGVGSKLILEGFKRCVELGFHLVFLIGHPSYYPRFGFKPAGDAGYELKQFQVSANVFMVCELVKGATEGVSGELRYPQSFF
jgi:predicted N-acetyltransferase YhbS